jgi:hypothetical protein
MTRTRRQHPPAPAANMAAVSFVVSTVKPLLFTFNGLTVNIAESSKKRPPLARSQAFSAGTLYPSIPHKLRRLGTLYSTRLYFALYGRHAAASG